MTASLRKFMNKYQTTAAILTAVEIETQAVHNLYAEWNKITFSGDRQKYYQTEFMREGIKHKLIMAQQDVMGMTSSALLCAKVIAHFRPEYIIMCGIAAGIGEEIEQIYGDILVPDVVWDYSTGKFVGAHESEIRFGDLEFLPRPKSIAVNESVLSVIRNIQLRKDNEFHIHIGPMACGSTVVANSEFVSRRVLPLFPSTIGLDMESYSVIYSATNFSSPSPKAVIIKGICDYANEEKSDQYQKFAAYDSSQFTKYLLERHLPLE